MNKYITKSLSLLLIVAVLIISGFIPTPDSVYAATLTSMSDTMSTVKKSTASNHTIVFVTPTGVASTQTIVVTLPSDFNGTSLVDGGADVDLLKGASASTVCSSGTAQTLVASGPSSSQWSAIFSGTQNRVLTFTSGGASATVAATNAVCIKIGTNTGGSDQYTNASTAASYTISLSAGSGADTGDIIVNILDDDQVSVSATVPATLSFAISDNSIGFGTLSTSAVRWATGNTSGSSSETSAHNMTASTNSTSGYNITVTGNTLTSGGNTITAIGSSASDVTANTGTEQYGVRMTASGGSGSVSSPYNGASNNYALDTGAFPDQVASSSAQSDTTTYAVFYAANIAGSTEAGSYTSTLTYVATGNF